MKNLTFILVVGMLCFVSLIQAQNTASLEDLLIRNSENHMGSVTDVFTSEELEILKSHFYQQNTNSENSSILLNRRISSTQAVVPVTAVNINPSDLTTIEDLLPSIVPDFEGAGTVRHNPSDGVFIIDNSNQVWIRGISTGTYTMQGSVLNVPPNESITGIEVLSGPQGSLYGISTNGVNSSTLLQIDTNTWEAMPIGNPNIVLPINLGRDANDNLYTVGIDGDKFYRINVDTGAETEIGDIGFDANYGQGMTYDPFTDKLLMTAFNNDLFDSELREVNINTGLSISLGTIVPGTLMQFGWAGMYDKDILETESNILSNFNYYPNPAQEKITLNSSQLIETAEIYTLLGQRILMKRIDSTNSILNISHLETGTYILKVVSKNESGSFKLIKL